jgi:ornithine carbamoyltransferase
VSASADAGLPSAVDPVPGLAGRSVLTLRHHDPEAVAAVLDLSARLKARRGPWPGWLAGRTVGMIFERPSTRTRVAFEAGVGRLGGQAVSLSPRDMQLGRGEAIEDTALVLSRLVDAIVLRTGPHEKLVELDQHAAVPVVNALTYDHHPCQALADAQTLAERFGPLPGLRVGYLGDGNNCCASLIVIAGHTGLRLACACPPGYEPPRDLVAWADGAARERGGGVTVTADPAAAAAGARALYTDTWVSMGDEEREAERVRVLTPYRLDAARLDAAAPDAVAMHPLPAHHEQEITYEVLHGPRSAAWDQAENRMHTQAALLAHILATGNGRAGGGVH